MTRGEIRQAANPDVLQHCTQTHPGVIGGIAPAHANGDSLGALLEFPACITWRFAQVDAAVIEQVMGMSWRAMLRQILRCRTQ